MARATKLRRAEKQLGDQQQLLTGALPAEARALPSRAARLETAYRRRLEGAYARALAEGRNSPFSLAPEAAGFQRQLVHEFVVGLPKDSEPSVVFELNRWTQFFTDVICAACKEKVGEDRQLSLQRKAKILDDYAVEIYHLDKERRSAIQFLTNTFITKEIIRLSDEAAGRYTGSVIEAATPFRRVADDENLTVSELRTAIDSFKAAKAENTTRKTTDRAKAEPRPAQAAAPPVADDQAVKKVFGDIPDSFRTQTYTRNPHPELVHNPAVLAQAKEIVHANRRRKIADLPEPEREKLREARRILQTHRRRTSVVAAA